MNTFGGIKESLQWEKPLQLPQKGPQSLSRAVTALGSGLEQKTKAFGLKLVKRSKTSSAPVAPKAAAVPTLRRSSKESTF
jgi:hypothetical protein